MAIESNAPVSTLSTGYYDLGGNLVQLDMPSEGVTYTPVASGQPPDIAKIGDFGSIPDLIGSDGTKITNNWELLAGSGSLAKYATYQIKYS